MLHFMKTLIYEQAPIVVQSIGMLMLRERPGILQDHEVFGVMFHSLEHTQKFAAQ